MLSVENCKYNKIEKKNIMALRWTGDLCRMYDTYILQQTPSVQDKMGIKMDGLKEI